MTTHWCELALVDGRVQAGVTIDVRDGRFAEVAPGTEPPEDARRLAGLTIPGLANAHSHAFHRALRSRTHRGGGSFWTWREQMYRASDRLDPDTYHALARATFAEMATAGVTTVGEFHYLHHRPGGAPYDDPNAMGEAVLAAASEAGIRITLLDTLYLHGGLRDGEYVELADEQRRFGDGTFERWAERVDGLTATEGRRIGAAVHSVRAVDPGSIEAVAAWADARGAVVHAHVSEQPAENQQVYETFGATPTAVLADAGILGPSFTAVHATHPTNEDVALLGGSSICLCPTTERDLGDGLGPSAPLAHAGAMIALGSDSHAVIDMFEEARAVEHGERLRSRERGRHVPDDLLAAATTGGHRSLGWTDAGDIAATCRADMVTVSLQSVRTAGVGPNDALAAVVFAATSSDVTDVMVDGRPIVVDGRHVDIDVVAELDRSIRAVMEH